MKQSDNEENAGYIASNSDNNIEKRSKDKKKSSQVKCFTSKRDSPDEQLEVESNGNDQMSSTQNRGAGIANVQDHKLSSSDSDNEHEIPVNVGVDRNADNSNHANSNHEQSNVSDTDEKDLNLWENLEMVGQVG